MPLTAGKPADASGGWPQNLSLAAERLGLALSRIDPGQADRFVGLMAGSREIFTAGAGRSGLVARCFAMRLMHLGKKAHVVGDTVTPAIAGGDTLLIVSGSGGTSGLEPMAEKAVQLGASLALVTANPSSRLAGAASLILEVPIPSPVAEKAGLPPPPLGSLFEQAAFMFLETAAAELMIRLGNDEDDMRRRHANLE